LVPSPKQSKHQGNPMTLKTSTNIVLAETRGATCILTLNRPDKRNALETATYVLMEQHLDEALANPTIANIVLTGAGNFFCSGGDLESLATRAAVLVGRVPGFWRRCARVGAARLLCVGLRHGAPAASWWRFGFSGPAAAATVGGGSRSVRAAAAG